jgi:hypothetical protein
MPLFSHRTKLQWRNVLAPSNANPMSKVSEPRFHNEHAAYACVEVRLGLQRAQSPRWRRAHCTSIIRRI